MPTEAQVKPISLTKPILLEYLEAQESPVRAKEVSIDLDTRASTATELLERCVAQGLVERTSNERPREYRITQAGRKRLEFLRSGQGQSHSVHDDPSELNPQREAHPHRTEPPIVSELCAEVLERLGGMRTDISDLFKALNVQRALGEGLPEHAGRISERLESLAEQGETEALDEKVHDLYRAHCVLDSLSKGIFGTETHERDEVRERIAELESGVGKDSAEKISRLVQLESKRNTTWAELREILEVREELHFPASICGQSANATRPSAHDDW